MIKYLIMDVDGTLTDGKLYMGSSGELIKVFHIKDGCGIHDLLIPKGITPIIITGRESPILKKRCKELKIKELFQGVKNKKNKLDEIVKLKNCSYENIAYIGDDLNDLPCMQLIKKRGGVLGCPQDAAKQVIEISDFVSNKNGGDGAVREFIEWILKI